jgi:hypothetical protein
MFMSLEIRRTMVATLLTAASLAAAPAHAIGVHASLQPATAFLNPGDYLTVSITLDPADAYINAFDAAIRFDPSRFAFVPPGSIATQIGPLMSAACPNAFHRFSAAGDSLAINLSLLCAGAEVNGPGVVYQVLFQALSPTGLTHIGLGPSTRFYDAGFVVSPLDTAGMEICISNCADGVGDQARTPSAAFAIAPNPWRGGVASCDFRLARAGNVSLSLLDVSGRSRLEIPARWFRAGAAMLVIDRGDLPSGMYFARLRTADGVRTAPVVLMR